MSDALSDIWRNDQRTRVAMLLFLIEYVIKEDGKSENGPEVQQLVEQLGHIPIGYFDKKLSKEEIINWIINDFGRK